MPLTPWPPLPVGEGEDEPLNIKPLLPGEKGLSI